VCACARCLARASTKDCDEPMSVRVWEGLRASCDEIGRGKTWESKVDCATVWRLPDCKFLGLAGTFV
jgi:hypothetical protein